MLNLADLIDDAKCYECTPDAVGREICCPKCTQQVIKRGKDETNPVSDTSVRIVALTSMI